MSEIKFTKTFKSNSRFENEKKIYELIKERKEFLSIEQNIIKEIEQKEKEKIIKNEEDKKEYRKMFCDLKPFNYILEYKGYKESNKISDMPEIYLEKGVCDLNVLVKLFYQNFTFPQIRYIIYQILKGINCLHNLSYDKNIFHNDLKGENVFVIIKDEEKRKLLEDIIKKYIENKGIKRPEINKEEFEKLIEKCIFKIGDFDLSHIITEDMKDIEFIPGPIQDIIDVDKEDSYEIGCILYFLRTGHYFLQGNDHKTLEFKKPKFSEEKLTRNYLVLLNKMLQVDKNFRINCSDALKMDFFKGIDENQDIMDILKKEYEDEIIDIENDIENIIIEQDKFYFLLPVQDRGKFDTKKYKKSFEQFFYGTDFFILDNKN